MAMKYGYKPLPEAMFQITRENVNELLDSGMLYAQMSSGNWWRARRNGKTQTWKRDASRIRIPVKMGLKSCASIYECEFVNGVLRSDYWRHKDDVPGAK
jgi:hypothetical protein